MALSALGAVRAAGLAAGLGAALCVSSAWAQTASRTWPQPRLPGTLQVFDAGQDVVLNGMPMRLHGFVSKQPVPDLVQALRDSLGQPLMVNRIGGKVVLGRAEGDYYVTVQIEAAHRGSRGAIAVSDLQAARAGREDAEREKRSWEQRLPYGTSVVSSMRSLDGMQQARQLIYSNRLGEELNRDRLQTVLEGEGLVFEREMLVDGQADQGNGRAAGGRVLFFKGTGKNGMATIRGAAGGRTFVVLNLVSTLGIYQ